MLLVLLTCYGGVLGILSRCLLPMLPFVFARSDRPLVRSGYPHAGRHGADLRRGRDPGGRCGRLRGGGHGVAATGWRPRLTGRSSPWSVSAAGSPPESIKCRHCGPAVLPARDRDWASAGTCAGSVGSYQLVRQSGTVADHTFDIAFIDPGVQAFAFTFG